MASKLRISKTKGILFSLIPVTALVLLCEILLRLAPLQLEVDALQVKSADRFEVQMFQSHLESKHFIRDPVTFWAPNPETPPFNALGYRGETLPETKAPGEFRILAVGDSNTLGNQRVSWANELATAATSQGLTTGKVTVINASAYGYTSFQGKHHLRRFLKYDPDLVLISFGGNDVSPNAVADKDHVIYRPHPVYAWFDRKSAIVNLIEYLSVAGSRAKSATEKVARATTDPVAAADLVSRVSLEDYESNLEEMIEQARSIGAIPVLLTRPIVFDYHGAESTSPMKPYYHKTLEVALETDTGLIDVDQMANRSWAIYDDHSHFNDKGYRLIASYIATALADVLSGRDYDHEKLKFRPESVDEQAIDGVRGSFSSWASLERNLETLDENRPELELAPTYASNFERDADGWHTSMLPSRLKDKLPEVRGGALCFTGEPTVMSLMHDDLDLTEGLPHLIWIDAKSTSDFSTRIFWKPAESSDFEDERSVSSAFYNDSGTPTRFFHVLPAGTSSVRVNAHTIRWRDAICIERIKIMSLSVTALRSAPSPE